MKIAFYKGLKSRKPLDIIICLATLSRYSHCELVFSDGVCASSSMRDSGVRFKKIDLTDDKWDVYELFDITEEDERLIRYYFQINDDDAYNYIGAIGSMFGLELIQEDKKWCSEICATTIGESPTTPGRLHSRLRNSMKI